MPHPWDQVHLPCVAYPPDMPTEVTSGRKALYGTSPRRSRLGSDRGSPAGTPAAWSWALIARAAAVSRRLNPSTLRLTGRNSSALPRRFGLIP